MNKRVRSIKPGVKRLRIRSVERQEFCMSGRLKITLLAGDANYLSATVTQIFEQSATGPCARSDDNNGHG